MFKVFSNIDKVLKEKKIEVVYPKGYKEWKKHFDETYKKTHSVSKTLDEIHGKQPNKGDK